MKTYFKYALCVVRDNRLLVLEESDQPLYIMPGGRPEDGESPEQALSRELKEELDVKLDVSSLRYLGSFDDVAAGKEPATVHIELYKGDFFGELKPGSEIERMIWFARTDDRDRLSPITRNKILPALLERGLIS